MRTTLTLDDDVAARIERLLAERETTLKSLVNDALRQGLDALERPSVKRAEYRLKPHSLGPCLLPSLDSVAEVLAWSEGEAYK